MPPGSTSKRRRPFVVVRVDRDSSDTHAIEVNDDAGGGNGVFGDPATPVTPATMREIARAIEEALDDANPDDGATLEWARVEATDAAEARRLARSARWAPVPTGGPPPAAGRGPKLVGNPYRRFGDDRVTLHDYEVTGMQDAVNAADVDMFDVDAGGTAPQIVDRLVQTDEFRDQWLEANADDVVANGLQAAEAYRWWLAGWRLVAIRMIERELKERAELEASERRGNPRGRATAGRRR